MKLYCSKILLFVLTLSILLKSSSYVLIKYVNTHKKPSIITTHHRATTKSRVLSECDIHSSSYDNDAEMKSVKKQFDDRTSQRFEEYEELMKDKRQKRKEERDKNILKIIEKDKMEKSLAEKVEKGCLRCGCALGGVAASVGLFGGLGIYGWEMAASAAAAKAAGDAVGVQELIKGLKETFPIENLFDRPLEEFITKDNYFCETIISDKVKDFYLSLSETDLTNEKYLLFNHYSSSGKVQGTPKVVESAKRIVGEAVEKASKVTTEFTATETAAVSKQLYSAIGYSVLAILIIVLVMIIIYLVLRYRRKKKMKKKDQYTKLLNE
ncbi:rifin [Plasmodium reichenowi]|uniref:Rifin n=1 Tax=Plasmodium reichenowi TaxID=5854 RepID=A0A060RMM6_PLARE|nr:rifin [Plasmodium reichenowi]